MKPSEFHFSDRLEHEGMPCLAGPAFKGKLLQWGLETSLKRKCMRFTGHFDEKADPEPFFKQLFSLPALKEAIKVGGGVENVLCFVGLLLTVYPVLLSFSYANIFIALVSCAHLA